MNNDTKEHIEKYGHSVIKIEGTLYLPPFAYSIGLLETYNHPEIICFGLSLNILHTLINDIAENIKSGINYYPEKVYDNIFRSKKAKFLSVNQNNISDYFGAAIEYYNKKDFPAIQLVWPDINNKLPWEEDFEKKYQYFQPLLDRNYKFKFREEPLLRIITTSQHIDNGMPITHVVHDKNGDWQFLTDIFSNKDARIIGLGEIVENDQTLNELIGNK